MKPSAAFKYLMPLLLILSVGLTTTAQISISGGASVSETFNSIGTTATASLPSGWRVDNSAATVRTVGSYASALSNTTAVGSVNMSTSAGNGIYNFGAGTASPGNTDRAVGGLSSGTASKSVNLYADLVNAGPGAIAEFTLSYSVEKYRNGSNVAGFSVQLYYSTNGTNWTSTGSDFLVSFPGTADNTGFATVPGATQTVSLKSLPVSLSAGSHLYLAWNYSVTSGTTTSNAQALGIDDIQITAIAAAPSGNADLSNLVLSSGTLSPAFISSTTTYTATVHNSVTTLTLTPTASDAGASVTINGNPVVSGTPSPSIPLAPGDNTINTVVTAANGTTKTYTVTVNRASSVTPALSTTALVAFGNICLNTTAGPNSFTISGTDLDGSDISISALSGFEYSESADGPYRTTLSFSGGSGFSNKTIYVRFTPTSTQSYDGSIDISGGGAAGITLSAKGAGINTLPVMTTGNATAVTSASATLSGTITSLGCGTLATYGIEYSTVNNFIEGNGTMAMSSNLAAGSFSAALSGLSFNTTYYYKAFVITSAGTSYGAQQTFTAAAIPVSMSGQEDLTYREDFSTVATWNNGFSGNAAAGHYAGFPASGLGSIPNPARITTASTSFSSGSAGGVQKGSGTIMLLSTGATDNTTSAAFDLHLDFTGVNAGALSFDWASVNNGTGDRNGSFLVYASVDGTTFTQIGSVPNFTNNVLSNGTLNVNLPSSFNGSATARLRFYYYNGTGGSTGSRPKISIDNLTVSAVSTTPCVTPSAQPSTLSFGTITETSIQGSFTAATPSANKYLVVMSRNSALTSNPVDGQVYTAGDELGDGDVIQNSSSTSFTASGLSGNTEYHFFVFALNNACAGGPVYLSLDPLAASATTVAPLPPCTSPAGQPTAFSFTAVATNTISASFSATTADEYLVLRSTSPALSSLPVNGTSYNIGNTLGNAVVVQRTNVTTFTAEALQPNTEYTFFVFALNSQGCLNGPVYNTIEPLSGSSATLPLSPCVTPTAQPTNLTLKASNTSVTGTFNSSPSADHYLVIRSTSATLSAVPSDNTDYTVGANFGGGTVVASNASASFAAGNLSPSTTYYFFVYAANQNCLGGTKYKAEAPLTGTVTTTATPPYQVYYGNWHSHSDYSDGNKDRPGFTPLDDYNYALTAECMDFLGISEHNHFSSVNNPGNLITDYHKGSQQANQFNATHQNFVAIYGMEWGVISGGGHVVVYGDGMDKLFGWESNVGGLTGNNYDVFVAKSDYTGPNGLFKTINDHSAYNTFATLAHPNSADFNNLSNVAYDEVADNAIVGTAVESGPANSTNTTYSNASTMSSIWYYQKMLSRGYRLGPVIDHDNHNTTFGKTTRSRTAVLAPSLSRTELVKAMREMRFYATEDCDIKVDFTVNTRVMGSSFSDRNAPSISVRLADPSTPVNGAKIRILHGIPGSGILPVAIDSVIGSSFDLVDNKLPVNATGYYYAEITNGSAMVITSPVWYTRTCSYQTETEVTACNSFTWQGTTYTTSTVTTRQFTTTAGCDSTVTLKLTINYPASGDTTAAVCESFNWYGTTYTTSGDYTQILTTVGGCDSILTLHLTIHPKPSVSITPAGPTTFCPAGSVLLTASAASSYQWSTGEKTGAITVNKTGNYNVTVTDANGCTATSEAVLVSADDLTPPTVRAKDLTVQLNSAGSATISPEDINNGSTDDCAIATTGYQLDKSSFDCSNLGANTVTLTVTDASGNTATGTAIINVVDAIAPTFTAPAAQIISLEGDCSIRVPDLLTGLTGSDNCGSVFFTQLPVSGTLLPSSHNGTHTITITANDGHGNTTTHSVILTAKDETAPVIMAPANITANTDKGKCSASGVALGTPVYSDNCSVTTLSNDAPAVYPKGLTTVTWTIRDAAGNQTTATQTVSVVDNEPPAVTCPAVPLLCYVPSGIYTVPALIATDNCSVVSVSYAISGATTRNGNGNNASGTFGEGTSTIIWTVTDGSGNVSTCSTTVVIHARLTAVIEDVYAVNPGGDPNTIYKGYGPTSLTLNATVNGGSGTYSYKWTAGSSAGQAINTTPSLIVAPATASTYFFNVKDQFGCSAPLVTKTIQVLDLRCGPKMDKVTVCVLQKGVPTTTCVAANNVGGYLAGGGYLGACKVNAATTRTYNTEETSERASDELSVHVQPNPSTTSFLLEISSANKAPVTIRVLNGLGALVESRTGVTSNGTLRLGSNYRAGIYFAEVVQDGKRITQKLIKR